MRIQRWRQVPIGGPGGAIPAIRASRDRGHCCPDRTRLRSPTLGEAGDISAVGNREPPQERHARTATGTGRSRQRVVPCQRRQKRWNPSGWPCAPPRMQRWGIGRVINGRDPGPDHEPNTSGRSSGPLARCDPRNSCRRKSTDVRCPQPRGCRSSPSDCLVEWPLFGSVPGSAPRRVSASNESVRENAPRQDGSCVSSLSVSSAALASTGNSTIISVNSPSLESTEMLPPCF